MENKERKEYSEALAVIIEKIREAIEKAAALRYVLDIEAAKARKDATTEEKGEKRAEAIDWEAQNQQEADEVTDQIEKLEDLAQYLQDMEEIGKAYADAGEMQREDKRQNQKKERAKWQAQAVGLLPEEGQE